MTTVGLPKRPMSIIILQIAIVLFGAVYLGGLTYGIYKAMGPGYHVEASRFAVGILMRMVPLAFLGLTFWGLLKRRAYGRWLGLACILAFPASTIYWRIRGGSGGMFLFEPVNDEQKLGEAFGETIAFALIIWWFFAFGFSRKAKAFFARPIPPHRTIASDTR